MSYGTLDIMGFSGDRPLSDLWHLGGDKVPQHLRPKGELRPDGDEFVELPWYKG